MWFYVLSRCFIHIETLPTTQNEVLIRHLLWLQKFFVKIKTDQQHFCIECDAFITVLTLQLTRPSYEKLIFLTIIFDWDFSIFILSRIFINFKRNTFKHIFTLFLLQSFNFGFIFFFIHYLFFFSDKGGHTKEIDTRYDEPPIYIYLQKFYYYFFLLTSKQYKSNYQLTDNQLLIHNSSFRIKNFN